jgi:hypothetical protein
MKRQRIPVFFTLALIIAYSFASYAQDLQVPVDTGGRIFVISADLEKKLGLFPVYDRFVEARIFRVSADEYYLEILFQKDADTMRKRMPLSERDYRDFCAAFSARLGEARLQIDVNQDGRYLLLASTTVYSLGLYGPLLVNVLDISADKNILAAESFIGSAGFFLPFYLTSGRTVSGPEAASYTYCSGFGAAHGAFAGLMIYGSDAGFSRGLAALMLVSSAGEGLGGFLLAEKLQLSLGRVDLTASASLWGTVWALESMVITARPNSDRGAGALLLGGSLGGAALGYTLAENYSRGDVIVNNLAAALGAYAPLAVMETMAVHSGRMRVGASMAGSLAGAASGYFLIRDKNFSAGQGGLMFLGESAGALVGYGAGYYFAPGNTAVSLTLSAVGAAAGFAALYYIFRDSVIVSSDGPVSIQLVPRVFSGAGRRTEGGMAVTENDVYDGMIPSVAITCSF